MPLKVMDLVDQRLAILREPGLTGCTVRQVCARAGISPNTFYEWRRRYAADGLEGLVPRSRRPVGSPRQLSAGVEDWIIALRKEHGWGPRKIRDKLRREGLQPLPATSTVQQVLARRGQGPVPRRRNAPRAEGTRFVRAHPNELWQVDGTQHRLAGGREFWVVDIVDDHSRFCLAALVGPALTGHLAWTAIRAAVAAYGLPAELLSDNGLCFTGRLHGHQVSFERQVSAAGIRFLHSRPYNPRCCGKIERFHQTQNDWFARRPPARSLIEAQTLLDTFREHYNTVRPHESLDGQTPAERYQPAAPVDLPGLDLLPADPFPPGSLPRKVRQSGAFQYGGRSLQLGERWNGITIGVIHEGARLHVYYGSSLIDTFLIGTMPKTNR